jgi:photosystem II stability/assembly factor-like uncharacterized protein
MTSGPSRRRSLVAGLALVLAATLAALVPALTTAPAGAAGALRWADKPTGTDARFRGLAPISAKVAWVSGSAGTVLRTTDGGRTWRDVSPGGDTAELEFRDIEAWDAENAVIMSAGTGGDSRIYRTADGGRTWKESFRNRSAQAFYDCIGFWDRRHGLAMSDPVNGKFRIIATHDAGASWRVVSPKGMPRAKEGEFGFAASGTCLVTEGRRNAYLASGGGASRIFFSRDRGRTWKVRPSTIPASPAGGVFSLAFRGAVGIAVGGDFEAETNGEDMSARTRTAGRTWRNGGDLGGYRSGVDWRAKGVAVAVGPSGSDVTRDGGRTWRTFSRLALDAVQCVGRTCWASGPEGTVARLVRR